MEEINLDQFLGNVMSNVPMLETMAKDPMAFQEVYAKVLSLSGRGFPVGQYTRLQERVYMSILVSSEVAASFSDHEMLLVYKDAFQKWFALPGFDTLGAGVSNPIFPSIQAAFTSSAANNHSTCFAYLMQQVAIEDYDNDGLTLLIALQKRHNVIIGLIAAFADPDRFGTTGALGGLIHPRIRAEFNNAVPSMAHSNREAFLNFRILR